MVQKQSKIIKGFNYLFLLLVFLPMFQFIFGPFKLSQLHGAYVLKVMPKLTTSSWYNQNFQDCTVYYLKHQSPFRGELIKLRNQLDYTFYKKINTILTLGKDNYIFDPFYIKARTGEDLLEKSVMDKKLSSVMNAKKVLDTLSVPILVCIAPNKANFYAEKLRNELPMTKHRNQTYYEKGLNKLGIHTINYDQLFLARKSNSNYPLIPKYGAHWSTYGAYVAADILLSQLDSINQQQTSSIQLDSVELTTNAKYSDDDFLPSLNLLEHWKSPQMAYPSLSFKVHKKVNALIISDSFFWNFYDLNIIQNCFTNNTEMWYYNKTKFDINRNEIGKTSDHISYKDLKNRDVIILLSTDPSLRDFGFGFFEQIEKLNDTY